MAVESGPGSGSGFGFEPDSPEIENAANIRTVSNTLSLFSAVYSCLCDVHSPYGTHNTWCYLWWRDLTSSEPAILGTAHFVLHVELATLRLLGG